MKFIKNFLVLSIAIIGFSYSNVQAQNISHTQKNIEEKVFKQILTLPYYGVFDSIKYKVDGDTVTLYGKVYSLGVKSGAERVVKRVDGVENVVNNIENLPLSPFDDSIRRNLIRTFLRDGGSLYRYLQGTQPSIRIIVDGGNVTLEGFVSNSGDYNLANILANSVPGVFSVENNLIVGKRQIP